MVIVDGLIACEQTDSHQCLRCDDAESEDEPCLEVSMDQSPAHFL